MARERGDTLNLYSWIEYKTTVVVTEIYKGKFKGDTIIIFSGDGGGDCGFRFKVGENYIVYGSKIKNTLYYNIYSKKRKNVFGTSTCTRTWNYSNEEIEGIRKYIKRKRIKK